MPLAEGMWRGRRRRARRGLPPPGLSLLFSAAEARYHVARLRAWGAGTDGAGAMLLLTGASHPDAPTQPNTWGQGPHGYSASCLQTAGYAGARRARTPAAARRAPLRAVDSYPWMSVEEGGGAASRLQTQVPLARATLKYIHILSSLPHGMI
jgi:hypothetical protein